MLKPWRRYINIWLITGVALIALTGCNRSATKPLVADSGSQVPTKQTMPGQQESIPTLVESPLPTPEQQMDASPTEEPVPTTEAPVTVEPTEVSQPTVEPTEAAPIEEPTPEPVPDSEQTYVVQPGDSLFGIAILFGVPADDLMARNDITDPNHIEIGQELIIPGVATIQPTATATEQIYIVQPGDNLFRISLQFGLSYEAVAAYNGLPWPYFVYVGQEIVIPPH
ncbi:MAG: LysM peptidoglycan-binding domain-containing protein [Chloroflexota bacterium]